MTDRIGKWPAWIDSYDGPSRMARVRIDGLTDGSTTLPNAVIAYAIGDRAIAPNSKDQTEILVLPGDPVWVEFERGDERFPIVTHYRLPRDGSPVDWLRRHQKNIEETADEDYILNAHNLTIKVSGKVKWEVGGDVEEVIGGKQKTSVTGAMESSAATSKHTAATHALNANTTIAGSISNIAGAGGGIGMTMNGGNYTLNNMTVAYIGCTITSDGKVIDHRHTHGGVQTGSGNTAVPN